MVIDPSFSSNPAEQVVHLVRKGRDFLGTGVNFRAFSKEDDRAAKITLERDVDFVLRLEQMEKDGFPENRGRTALDSRLGGPKAFGMHGYSDEI
jgi:hypothetical protein